MSRIEPIQFTSKTEKKILIRTIELKDEKAFYDLGDFVRKELYYTVTEPVANSETIEVRHKWIQSKIDHPSKIALVAMHGEELAGSIIFDEGFTKRLAHQGDFGLFLAKDYREDGIGSALLGALIDWAKSHAVIEKINLKVHANNARAIHLYRKLGFVEEGRQIKDMKYPDGTYIDTVLMAKFVK